MTARPEERQEKQKRRGAILVYETLRDDILWLRIAPGSAIDEVALATRFAVSRTPIREALLLLQGDWLVEFLRNRTTIVAPLSLNNSGQYFDSHLILARTMVRAAAASGKADATLLGGHVAAFRAATETKTYDVALKASLALMRDLTALTGNIFLERYFGHSLDSGIRTMIMYYFPSANRAELEAAGAHMAAVVEAVASGDADASDAAIRTLLMHEIEIILRALHPAIGESMEIQNLEPVT